MVRRSRTHSSLEAAPHTGPEEGAVGAPGRGGEGASGELPRDSAPEEPLFNDPTFGLDHEAFLLRSLLENVPEQIYFKDLSSRFVSVSRHLALRLGIDDPSTLVGKSDFDFFNPEHADQAFRDEQEIIRTGRPLLEVEEREMLPNGIIRWVSTSKLPLRDPDGKVIGTFGVSRDITERKRMEEQIAQRTFYDALTTLPNRALFLSRLEHLCLQARRRAGQPFLFAVAQLNLDRFQGINESLGHQAGDELLVQIARRLESVLRTGDTLARLGADEFALLLEDIRSPTDVTRVAERVREVLTPPFNVRGTEIFSTASLGLALSSPSYERAEEMLRDADIALHRAKSKGPGHHQIFDAEMHRKAVSQLQVETDLRRAIERREFIVYYQPIIEMTTNRITGFEALVRWPHPTRGLVPPDVFIPLAEQTGLIDSISEVVLAQSCAQTRRWQEQFPSTTPLRVSVNLSAPQLRRPQVVDQIRRTLAETGLGSESLTVELTESALMNDVTAGTAVIEQLRAIGIQINIDDFGTGYSSLSYLHALPVDALKIDRAFVKRMTSPDGSVEIVRAIIALAKALNMKVVAEGVETGAQREALVTLGCHSAQGFFFSRPQPAAEIEKFLVAGGVLEGTEPKVPC